MISLAELLLAVALPLAADTPGTVLPTAPQVPPGTISEWPADRLAEARARWFQGDAEGTVTVLEPWLAAGGARGRSRASAHLLAGMAHMTLGNLNLASSHFYRVRRSNGPLAPYGAWYEALSDHRRGRHLVAARECAAYRNAYPEGIHASECLILEAAAYGAAGHRRTAEERYKAYLDEHPESPREEEIDIARIQAAAVISPALAIRMAHSLWLDHSYPSTDLAIHHILADLAAEGHDTTFPDDPTSRMARCSTLRRSGRPLEAWDMFTQLSAEADENEQIASWVERNADRFAWSAGRFSQYADKHIAEYNSEPSGDLAWSIYVAFSKAGMWDQASEWARLGREQHANHWRWRDREPLARAEMLSGNYMAAHDVFSTMRGSDAAFMAAFCAYKAGELDKAIALFSPLTERSGEWKAAAHYWRGQARLAQGEADAAQTDLALAIEHDRSGWYWLLQQPTPLADELWTQRDGRWHGEPEYTLPTWNAPATTPAPAVGLAMESTPVIHVNGKTMAGLYTPNTESDVQWTALSWPMHPPQATETGEEPEDAPPVAIDIPAPQNRGSLPNGYVASDWFDPEEATRNLILLARRHGEQHEDLWTAHDLIAAGLYGEAARIIGPMYESWRNTPGTPPMNIDAWRELFLVSHAHHYAARFTSGLNRHAPDEASQNAALQLAYPIVRAPELWTHSQQFNLDPFLVMGIMRQESTYQEFVVSHAGAIGLVQVMPRTGARVAALMGEEHYSPRDLENPSINIRYGSFYLSQLMERFDGNYPLAIASYNGGPHNVSRWMRQIKGTVTLAEFVEHIPWSETRNYVKLVTGSYARYAELYGPENAALALPGPPDADDPTVINF